VGLKPPYHQKIYGNKRREEEKKKRGKMKRKEGLKVEEVK
jgi:hypothetical protein